MGEYFAWLVAIGAVLAVLFLALHLFFEWRRWKVRQAEWARRLEASNKQFYDALLTQVDWHAPAMEDGDG